MSYTIINPATGKEMETVEHATVEETDDAIARAGHAQRQWAAMAPAERAEALRSFARTVEADIENLAQIEVRNSGHPVGQARWEATHVRNVLDYYSAAPERMLGKQIPVAGGIDITFNEPLGVIGIITPWNFPMTIASWGFVPALAAGNAVVLKPAEWTPLSSLRLAELGRDAGLDVRKIVFTGSTEVGKSVMRGAADQIKRVTLELGGKSANIVFADADVDKAAATAPYSVFENAGQDCCARSRILVQKSVLDEFMEKFETAVKGVVVGDPTKDATEVGPLVHAKHLESVSAYLDKADIAFRGSAPDGPGNWFAPTVALSRGLDDPCMTDEIFGPIVTVHAFEDEADAIAISNATEFGLSGSIWTRDVGRAIRVSRAVESGNLSVNSHSSVRYNTPFGGFKQSGLGRELGPDAPLHFTEEKNVFIPAD